MQRPDAWWGREAAPRRALVAAALMLVALVATGALGVAYALAAVAVVIAAAWIGSSRRTLIGAVSSLPERRGPRIADPLVEAVIAGLPDPVIVLDREGRVLAFNTPAGRMAPALRRGEPASLALRVPEIVEAMRRAVAGNAPQRVEFFERVPLDRWFAACVTPVELAVAAPGFERGLVLISMQDLTPLRRVEEMRADFVANASHELRTPLASLSGFIDTLQGPARDDAAARERFIEIMKGQARRMARLIDDLLSLSRIELNQHLQPHTTADVVSVVRQVADALQVLATERGVTIAIKAPPEPLVVIGDRDELTRVFENLIENALKYGGGGKRVDITLERADAADGAGEAVVVVRDYGAGIPPEHLPRLTERFYRVDVGHSRAEGGTGLGLALVKHIVTRHRGRLTIESVLGQGATFTVRLPLSQIAARAETAEFSKA
ncbi:MAG: two-component sensor histidine kinase [Hyphomicrobiales bacterium]|nr:two-component sensor histidine kinase [Hyphomicrobiales bacterium]